MLLILRHMGNDVVEDGGRCRTLQDIRMAEYGRAGTARQYVRNGARPIQQDRSFSYMLYEIDARCYDLTNETPQD